jgi:hypothetical protein
MTLNQSHPLAANICFLATGSNPYADLGPLHSSCYNAASLRPMFGKYDGAYLQTTSNFSFPQATASAMKITGSAPRVMFWAGEIGDSNPSATQCVAYVGYNSVNYDDMIIQRTTTNQFYYWLHGYGWYYFENNTRSQWDRSQHTTTVYMMGTSHMSAWVNGVQRNSGTQSPNTSAGIYPYRDIHDQTPCYLWGVANRYWTAAEHRIFHEDPFGLITRADRRIFIPNHLPDSCRHPYSGTGGAMLGGDTVTWFRDATTTTTKSYTGGGSVHV